MLHFLFLLLDIGWPQTHNFNKATKNLSHFKPKLHLSSIITTGRNTSAQPALDPPDQEELCLDSSTSILFILSWELQLDGSKNAVIANLTKLISPTLKLMRTSQHIKKPWMKMIDHGPLRKKDYLDPMDFKPWWTKSSSPSETTIWKTKRTIFKVLTLTTF